MPWNTILEGSATTAEPNANTEPHFLLPPSDYSASIEVSVEFAGDLQQVNFLIWRNTPVGWGIFTDVAIGDPGGASRIAMNQTGVVSPGEYYIQISGFAFHTIPPEPGSYRIWAETISYI